MWKRAGLSTALPQLGYEALSRRSGATGKGEHMATKTELRQQIIDKADADPSFRALLKKDPAAAIKSLGMSTRSNLKIQVLEESEDQGYFVLPFKPKPGAGGELSDAALGAVTGGAAAKCPMCGAG
jgi:hypothetical protein